MKINYLIIVVILFAAIVLILFLIKRNKKDQKKFTEAMNKDFGEPEKHPKDKI